MSLAALFRSTPAIAPTHQRAYMSFAVGTVVAFLIHVCAATAFWFLGARTLALLNAVSLAAYAAAFLWNRRGNHLAAAAVCVVELAAHQALAVHYLGWASGFQYYLVTVIPVVFFLPEGRMWAKVALVAVVPVAYLAIWRYGQVSPPAVPVPTATLSVLYAVNVTAVFALLGFFAWVYARTAERAEAGLRTARVRTESLLHSILPVPIAARLEAGEQPIADAFENATILFADLVGFTPLAQSVSPGALVALLDDVFSCFDALVERRGLEKIKTIGDAYMVAGGVPALRPDHVDEVAGLALDMMAALRERGARTGVALQMRIGMHSGPVVAGVIGRRKFAYDLWGDTVNTAARMESHGVPGAIHVTSAVHDALAGRCRFEARGTVDVKGKGPMDTWLLLGWRVDDAPAAEARARAWGSGPGDPQSREAGA